MRLRHALPTIITSLILLLLPIHKSYASTTIYPYIQEAILTKTETAESHVTFKNDENKTLNVNPKVYSYNPKDQTYKEDGVIFTQILEQTYDVDKGKKITIKYKITPQEHLQNGTYFNLIVLENTQKDDKDVGILTNLSQLVVLQLTDSKDKENFLGNNFADINIKITNQGIPFLSPTIIEYSMKNSTNYVLSPKGEIQIFNYKIKKNPQYIKINKDEKRLYPEETITEKIKIDSWNLQDVLSARTIIGRFYNGIDEGEKTIEIKQNPVIIPILTVIIITLTLLTLLAVSVIRSLKRKTTTLPEHS